VSGQSVVWVVSQWSEWSISGFNGQPVVVYGWTQVRWSQWWL